MNLYIYSYNNYYNRLVKKAGDSITSYQDYLIFGPTEGVYGFTPGDGVNTTQLLGSIDQRYEGKGNYLIAHNPQTNEIDSRWFIIDHDRTRDGQWQLTLRRDLVVDYFNIIRESPMFVEKATLKESDPFIFNKEEGITVNRIKQKEVEIKDETKRSWLVAYIAREKANGEEYTLSGEYVMPGVADLTVSRDSWEFKDYIDGNKLMRYNPRQINFSMNFRGGTSSNIKNLRVSLFKQNEGSTPIASFWRPTDQNLDPYISSSAVNLTDDQFNNQFRSTYNDILDYLPTATGLTFSTKETAERLLNLNNTTVKFDGDDNIYKIKITKTNENYVSDFNTTSIVGSGDIVYKKVQGLWSSILTYANPQNAIAKGKFYKYSVYSSTLTMTLTSIGTAGSLTYSIPATRNHLSDAPYDMICAPYEDTEFITTGTSTKYKSYQSYVYEAFNHIAIHNAGESGVLYDIQRLPYCPIPSLKYLDSSDVLDCRTYKDAAKELFTIKKGENEVVGVMFACTVSNFYKSINLDEPIVIDNKKMQSECEMYRICSPNYNGVFEFDAAMNGGLSSLNIYCSYKPFNPYIQVSPDFDLLYGDNFGDSRGLICGGEWSLPIVTSQWSQYERQNVNYQNIFNRQIENLKVQQKYQKIGDIANIVTGSVGGLIGGMFAGQTMIPGAGGLLGGGLLGGAASIAGGIVDYNINQALRAETLDYTQDLYQYQLGNIQALPQSLSRTSAFTINNKIFPFIEYYTCTEEEKEAFAYKIAYNGMTVMRIGKFSDYESDLTNWSYKNIKSKGYFKGKLIHTYSTDDLIGDMGEGYHLINQLANEVDKGFFYTNNQVIE